jgi:hypothetical protein
VNLAAKIKEQYVEILFITAGSSNTPTSALEENASIAEYEPATTSGTIRT